MHSFLRSQSKTETSKFHVGAGSKPALHIFIL
jgi:hypothetical protein